MRAPRQAASPTSSWLVKAAAGSFWTLQARVRVGDVLSIVVGGEHVGVDVVDVADDAGAVSVTVEWADGGVAIEGERLVLWPPPPDYSRRFLGWLSGRMKEKHWALGDRHDETPVALGTPTGDPLAAVEAMHKRWSLSASWRRLHGVARTR